MVTSPTPLRKLRVALISDELTRSCLARECSVQNIGAWAYPWQLRMGKPDLLFVESAWSGVRNGWKYQIAAYPDHPERTNRRLRQLVARARDLGIPTVFWNKEDSVHFERFIDSASLFDHVFTVDANCVSRYRERMGPQASVTPLMFPVQPATHHFTGFGFRRREACFVGSYSQHIHERRREWQDMVFAAATRAGLGVAAYDRNSGRKARQYRYPPFSGMSVRPAVPHERTAQLYKDYLVSLNVNTVADSPTMYSRRLVEILACGGIAVTSPAVSVDRMFKDYCHVVSDQAQAEDLFGRLRRDGPSASDLERARAGAEYVAREHTWAKRMEQVAGVVGL